MKELFVALIIVAVIACLILVPWALVWSLNTLFPVLAIPYSFKTWAAALFIESIFGVSVAVAKKSDY